MGWYETTLPWEGDHPPLPNHHTGSSLETQVRKQRKSGKLEEYDAIIRDQLKEGIVEPAPNEAVCGEFYMPHQAVIREGEESAKMHVVYDCSTREGTPNPSLKDCLDVGPPLKNGAMTISPNCVGWQSEEGLSSSANQERTS